MILNLKERSLMFTSNSKSYQFTTRKINAAFLGIENGKHKSFIMYIEEGKRFVKTFITEAEKIIFDPEVTEREYLDEFLKSNLILNIKQ